MQARLTIATAGAWLALTGSAFAASPPSATGFRLPPLGRRVSVTRAMPQVSGTSGPTLYVNGTSGSDTTNGQSNACTTSTQPCATIQHAINVAPSTAKISVAAGDYPEQLTIESKNLTISGAGRSQTAIDPTTLTQTDTNTGVDAVVAFDATTGGGLNGVTVDGTGAPNSAGTCNSGITLYNATGTISADAVKVTPLADATGCDYGVVSEAGAASSRFVMKSVTVSEYGGNGVFCGEGSQTCSITGSTVTGNGPSALLQVGIDLQGDPSGMTLSHTRVSGNADTAATLSDQPLGSDNSVGVFVIGAGASTLTRNVVTGNDVNVEGFENTGAWTLTHNSITHATNYAASVPNGNYIGDGLLLDAVSGATVYGNSITSNANRGIDLFWTTGTTFGGPGLGQPNTVSNNGDDGIALTSLNGSPPSSGNTIQDNVVDANAANGIHVGGDVDNGNGEQDNTFSGNTMQGNLRFDALDQSTGAGTAGTANTWTGNTCTISSPAAICAPAS